MIPIFSSKNYSIPLPEQHLFPIQKYALVEDQLCYEGLIHPKQIQSAPFIQADEVLAVHSPTYWSKINSLSWTDKEIRKIGFPSSAALRDRSLASAGGTWAAAKAALTSKLALNLAGGTHHAFYDFGEGYCVLNDLAIAARNLLKQQLVKKVMIVDLDVHQGNGTAALFPPNQSEVFTFSMHAKDNYPYHKQISTRDFHLNANIKDDEYLSLLNTELELQLANFKPDIIFYQAGVDALSGDLLGKLNLSLEGLRQRDKMVIHTAADNQIPLVIVMGGGYHKSLSTLVSAHAQTYRTALERYS